MTRDLNLSLIVGALLANLPVWQWRTKIELLAGIFVITMITMMLLIWLKDKKLKKKSLTAATARLNSRNKNITSV